MIRFHIVQLQAASHNRRLRPTNAFIPGKINAWSSPALIWTSSFDSFSFLTACITLICLSMHFCRSEPTRRHLVGLGQCHTMLFFYDISSVSRFCRFPAFSSHETGTSTPVQRPNLIIQAKRLDRSEPSWKSITHDWYSTRSSCSACMKRQTRNIRWQLFRSLTSNPANCSKRFDESIVLLWRSLREIAPTTQITSRTSITQLYTKINYLSSDHFTGSLPSFSSLNTVFLTNSKYDL